MRKKKFNLHLSSLVTSLCSIMLGLTVSTTTMAQAPPTSPADCKTGCTSNDVQIQSAYLSNASGVALSSSFVCPQSGVASVYLTLELTTKTPRVGVVIYCNVKNFTPPSTIGSTIATPSQCFGITLNQPTNKVTFQTPFNWTCSNAIVLTDVFIGWGTGNTDFCTGTAFQCPATSSKCFSLPPGTYIPIITPQPSSLSDSKCASTVGCTDNFDLTSYNTLIKNGQSNVDVTWYKDFALTTLIANPTTFAVTNDSAAYAKLANHDHPDVYNVGTLTLTVYCKPAAPTVSVTQPTCTVATGKIEVTSATSGLTFSLNGGAFAAYPAAGYTVAASTNNTLVAKTAAIDGACPSAASSANVNAQPATPGTPAATVIQPTCSVATGTISVTSPDNTVTYTVTGPSPATTTQSNTSGSFPSLAPGTYSLTASKNGCTSGSTSKTVNAQPATPPAPTLCILQEVSLCGSATGSIRVTAPTGTGYEYSKDNGATWQTSTDFTGLAAGSNPSIKVKSPDGCISATATSCSSAAASCTSGITRAASSTSESTLSETSVKAYPNPFSDRVKFLVTSSAAGRGSLEVYNMMGQRVKTVYQGFITKGSQTFELSLPNQQVANLIYVLRVGDKKMSGKLLQINQ